MLNHKEESSIDQKSAFADIDEDHNDKLKKVGQDAEEEYGQMSVSQKVRCRFCLSRLMDKKNLLRHVKRFHPQDYVEKASVDDFTARKDQKVHETPKFRTDSATSETQQEEVKTVTVVEDELYVESIAEEVRILVDGDDMAFS